VRGRGRTGPKTTAGRQRALANLRRGGSPGRKPGTQNAATLEVRASASRFLVRHSFLDLGPCARLVCLRFSDYQAQLAGGAAH
jgi:hypothetical protein